MTSVAEAPDKPVYLITGSDRPKVETAIARCAAISSPSRSSTSPRSTPRATRRSGLCNAGSLFGDARLIVVTEVDGVKADEVAGRLEGRRRRGDPAYLSNPAPATVLALVAEELKSSSALWKACEKGGRVLVYDVAKGKLQGWVADQFKQRGVRAEPEAVAALIQLVGDDLRALKPEVDKLATWAGDEPIGEREVEALVAPDADVPIFELTEAWSVRDSARALAVSETIFERESKPRRDVAPASPARSPGISPGSVRSSGSPPRA